MAYTAADLADELGVSVGDIMVIAHQHGVTGDLTMQDLADVRRALDDMCGRTVWAIPELTGRDPGVCRCRAMGGLEHAPGPSCP